VPLPISVACLHSCAISSSQRLMDINDDAPIVRSFDRLPVSSRDAMKAATDNSSSCCVCICDAMKSPLFGSSRNDRIYVMNSDETAQTRFNYLHEVECFEYSSEPQTRGHRSCNFVTALVRSLPSSFSAWVVVSQTQRVFHALKSTSSCPFSEVLL
jgi:hypothetical protein